MALSLTNATDEATDYATGTYNDATNAANDAVDGIIDDGLNLLDDVTDETNGAIDLLTGIGTDVNNALDIVADAGSTLSSTMSSVTTGLADTIGAATSVMSNVTSSMSTVTSSISSSIGNLTSMLATLNSATGTLTAGDKLLAGTLTSLLSTLNGATSTIGGVTSAVSGASSSLAGAAGALTSSVSSITSTLKLPGSIITDSLNSTITGATSSVGSAISSISGAASSMSGLVSSLTGINTLLAGATTGLSAGISSLLGGITSSINSITSEVSGAIDSLGSSLKDITGGLAALEVPMYSSTNQITDIKTSVIWLDIAPIVNNDENKTVTPSIDILLKLHNEDFDLDNNDLVTLKNLIISRDYNKSIGDYMEANIQMPIGVYIKKVYPYLHNSEVSIIRDIRIVSDEVTDSSTKLERYKAVFLKDKNANLPTHKTGTEEDLNQIGMVNLTLQLIDRTVEPLRIKTTYGVFDRSTITGTKSDNYTIKEFLYSVMNEESVKIKIEGQPCIEQIDIETPDNTDRLAPLIVPSGTRVLELPTLVQEKWSGVYNGGIGTYIQPYKDKKTLFIYSLYNPNKIVSDIEKIIFYVPLTGSHSIGRYTYSYIDHVLKVITDPNNNITDRKESDFMSTGNGVRITNSNSFMNNPIIATTAGPYYKKAKIAKEIIIKDRKDNLNYAAIKRDESITSNIFSQVTEINKAAGSIVRLVWHNADYELLFPGAAVTIATLSLSAARKDLKGVIHKVDVTINGESSMSGVTANRKPTFDVTCVIDIFIHKDTMNTEAN